MNFRDVLMSAATAGGGPPFDRYLDSATGSDSNDGLTPATAKLTFAGITQAANMRIGIAKGSTFREAISITSANVRLGTYGTGARPAFFGSTEVTTEWTNTSGDVWSTALASSPTNLYLVADYSRTGITKLTKNTSTPTTPGADQWGHSSSTLYVNSATDPNTLHYERVTAASTHAISVSAADVTIEGIGAFMATSNGISVGADRCTLRDCDASANANDGINGVVAKSCLIERCYSWRNGTSAAKSATGSDGDGISFHGDGANDYSEVTIRFCDVRYNRKSGIGHQTACISTSFGNFLDENYANIVAFPATYGGATPMVQRFAYDIVRRTVNDGGAVSYGAGLTHALTVYLENLTIYTPSTGPSASASTGLFVPASAGGGAFLTMSLKNSIIKGFARGIDSRDATATLSLENNCLHGNTAAYFDNGTRTPALSTIPVASITTDPTFTDAASGDFSLQSGSPCINAGQALTYTSDKAGNQISGLPDMGALERVG